VQQKLVNSHEKNATFVFVSYCNISVIMRTRVDF